VSSVKTVEQTITVRDSGDFLIPLDLKTLAAGVKVKPTEVHLVVQVPPVAHVRRDSTRVAALRPGRVGLSRRTP
jgi:hypothetical protein